MSVLICVLFTSNTSYLLIKFQSSFYRYFTVIFLFLMLPATPFHPPSSLLIHKHTHIIYLASHIISYRSVGKHVQSRDEAERNQSLTFTIPIFEPLPSQYILR